MSATEESRWKSENEGRGRWKYTIQLFRGFVKAEVMWRDGILVFIKEVRGKPQFDDNDIQQTQ